MTETFPNDLFTVRENVRKYTAFLEQLAFNSFTVAGDESAEYIRGAHEMAPSFLSGRRMQTFATGLVRVPVLVRIDTTYVTPSGPGCIPTMRFNLHFSDSRFSFSRTIVSTPKISGTESFDWISVRVGADSHAAISSRIADGSPIAVENELGN